jgi:hypothetical protein
MKSATDRVSAALAGGAASGLATDSIAAVKDFTARKTLEQAHAFARGLADALGGAPREGETKPLAHVLTSAGISLADAEQVAAEGSALIALMEERDRRAEAFQAAARAAGESERALYDRLSSFARLLRQSLGPSSPLLGSFGVPIAEGFDVTLARARAARPAPLDITAYK